MSQSNRYSWTQMRSLSWVYKSNCFSNTIPDYTFVYLFAYIFHNYTKCWYLCPIRLKQTSAINLPSIFSEQCLVTRWPTVTHTWTTVQCTLMIYCRTFCPLLLMYAPKYTAKVVGSLVKLKEIFSIHGKNVLGYRLIFN